MFLLRGITFLCVSIISFFLIDFFYSELTELNGIVVGKQYQRERISVNTGGGYYEPPKFLIMVGVLDEVFTFNCPSKIYFQKEKGDMLFVKYRTGYFTNMKYSIDEKK